MATKFSNLNGVKINSEQKTIFEFELNKNLIPCLDSTSMKPDNFENVLWIGFDKGPEKDVFKAWDNDDPDAFYIFIGIKGNEFK